MPIWEYKCKKCGKIEEVLYHSFSEAKRLECIKPPICPKCKIKMEKILSTPGKAVIHGPRDTHEETYPER